MKGGESKVWTIHDILQICIFVVKDVAAKYTREGEGHKEEGWVIDLPVVSAFCTDFSDTLFETMAESHDWTRTPSLS